LESENYKLGIALSTYMSEVGGEWGHMCKIYRNPSVANI